MVKELLLPLISKAVELKDVINMLKETGNLGDNWNSLLLPQADEKANQFLNWLTQEPFNIYVATKDSHSAIISTQLATLKRVFRSEADKMLVS